MAGTIHLPPADHDGRYGPDFLHGVDLERLHDRPARPRRRWATIVALALTAVAVVVVALLWMPREPAPPEGAYDSGIAQAIDARDAGLEDAHDSGIDLLLRER